MSNNASVKKKKKKRISFGLFSQFYKSETLGFDRTNILLSNTVPFHLDSVYAPRMCNLIQIDQNSPGLAECKWRWEVGEGTNSAEVSFLIRHIKRCPAVMMKEKMRIKPWVMYYPVDFENKCNSGLP